MMNQPEELSPPRERQLRLLPASQPLVARFGAGFFRRLPRQPGVYLMRDESDRLIYVGKAKSLRQRLNSYRHPALTSRKIVRLVHAVRE
jgi:excinuclease ABC subunit C